MIKVRLEGLPDEVAAMTSWMRCCFIVVDESAPHANRPPSKFSRVYLTIKAESPPEEGKSEP